MDWPAAHANRAVEAERLLAAGRAAEAEDVYRQLIEKEPKYHPAYHGLGLLALRFGKLETAAELIGSAIALDEENFTYHRDRGEICRRLGRIDAAVAHARRAVALDPREPTGHYNLGVALAEGDPQSALASYRAAIRLDPAHGRAFNNMGSVLEALEETAAAERAYRRALAIDAEHVEALTNLGALASRLGRIDEARGLLERALRIAPDDVAAHFALNGLKRYAADDPHLAALERLMSRGQALQMPQKAQLCFALGKARDDVGDHEGAFAAYAEGNRLKRATITPHPARGERLVAFFRERFTPAVMEALPGSGNDDRTPVFIVGMPRSGTSLIEQILASHPGVHGAGELRDLHQIAADVLGTPQPGLPFAEPGALTTERLRVIAQRYLAKLRAHAPAAARITDKMPANFHYVPLIKLALPGARIIHSVRDPMDTCLSCYTHLFKDDMDFAYDFESLGSYYVRYAELMALWRELLPDGCVLDVRYEDLVDDMPGQTRRMLDHIGLPWDDACLAFFENERPVRTASLAQVRRPIYRSSVGGWRRFETHLAPLLEIVRDYRDHRD